MALPNEGPLIPQWTLGERMAKSRRDAGYTQAEMGAFFDVKSDTVSTWETLTRQPKKFFDKLRRWAEICNVDFDWLVTGTTKRADGGSMLTYLDIVDEPQLPFPNFDYPPAKHTPALELVATEGGRNGADRAAC